MPEVCRYAARALCGLRRDGGDAPALDQLDELVRQRVHDLRVELAARAALELRDRVLGQDSSPVDALGGHGVVRVGDEDDPRPERDPNAGQPVWVPAAVPALVVVE